MVASAHLARFLNIGQMLAGKAMSITLYGAPLE
jgi:hypothetical protein